MGIIFRWQKRFLLLFFRTSMVAMYNWVIPCHVVQFKKCDPLDIMLASLNVDDLQISIRHTDLKIIKDKLQESVQRIETWANNNGFKFSLDKTKAVHFTKKLTVQYPPPIFLHKKAIPYVTENKFLGVTFDSKLSFSSHIAQLKVDCTRILNLMRTVSSNSWGADQYILMKIYRALIKPKLEYGCIVYSTASETLMRGIDSIANEALRIATAVFRTTPNESLYILTNELPLEYRRKLMPVKYVCKINSHLGNPAFRYAVPNYYGQTFQAKRLISPFCIRARKVFEDRNVANLYIKAAFSHQISGMVTPTLKINLSEIMAEYPKATTSGSIYKQILASILKEYNADNQMYTDGSKSDGRVGASVVFDWRIIASSLPHCTTILSAELYACP